MSSKIHADDLTAVVRYALETTRATIVCPFHDRVIIRVGDDAAESHAFERAKRIIKSDGEFWASDVLREEFAAVNSAPPQMADARSAIGEIPAPEDTART